MFPKAADASVPNRIDEIMTDEVHFLAADMSIQDAAQLMAELDAGALPVGQADDLRGILTDRDVLIRVVAKGRDPAATRVEEVMSTDVMTCRAEDSAEHVIREMRTRQIRRVPVRDADGRVVGLVGMRALAAAALDAGDDGQGPLR